jgi:hypothetical protein
MRKNVLAALITAAIITGVAFAARQINTLHALDAFNARLLNE